MLESSGTVQWAGRKAAVTLPEHVDVSNAGQIREDLLSAINRGATALIADMTATVSCDHAGADAVVRVYQLAAVHGAELRLVVTAPIVSRGLSIARWTGWCPSTRRWKLPWRPAHRRRCLPGRPTGAGRESMAIRRRLAPGRQHARFRQPVQRTAASQKSSRACWGNWSTHSPTGSRWRTTAACSFWPADSWKAIFGYDQAELLGSPCRMPHPRGLSGRLPRPPGRLCAGTGAPADGRGAARRAPQGREPRSRPRSASARSRPRPATSPSAAIASRAPLSRASIVYREVIRTATPPAPSRAPSNGTVGYQNCVNALACSVVCRVTAWLIVVSSWSVRSSRLLART
jgi:anti-anti-sigma regulatory factor